MLRLLSPKTITQLGARYFGRVYDTGSFSVVSEDDQRIEARFVDCRSFDRNMWTEISGSIEGFVELAGGKEVTVRITEGGHDEQSSATNDRALDLARLSVFGCVAGGRGAARPAMLRPVGRPLWLVALLLLGCASGAEAKVEADARAADVIEDTAAEDTESDDTGESSDTGEPMVDTAPADVAASCMNGTRDGDETDVDCGGALCPKCVVGRTCALATDCASASCGTDGVCGCTLLDHCPTGTSCVARLCQAAVASCAATKTAYAGAADGEYWIKPATGAAYRAYCDMALGREICTEAGGTVTGKTREGSGINWSGHAKLDHKTGLCTLYALKGPTYPFEDLNAVAGQTMKTCAAFGFKADGTLGNCLFGSGAGRGKCGFTITTYNRYGNQCTGCTLNAGNFHDYTLQGPISNGTLITNFSGTIVTTCRVR